MRKKEEGRRKKEGARRKGAKAQRRKGAKRATINIGPHRILR